MSDTRNLAVERIAEHLRFPCKHYANGCAVKMTLGQKFEHEDTCHYRSFNCPLRACSWSGFLPDMTPHLHTMHASRFLEGERQRIKVELNSPTLFYLDWAISCYGQVFRLNVLQNIPNSMLYVCTYYIGSENDATKYMYTISLTGPQHRRIDYRRETHRESTKMSGLCASNDCFNIKGDLLKYFVDDGNLELEVFIERVSE